MTHHGKARENFITKDVKNVPPTFCRTFRAFPQYVPLTQGQSNRLLIGRSRVRIPHGAPQNASSLSVTHLLFLTPLHLYISFPLSVGRARLRPTYTRLMADCRFDSGEPQSSFFIFLLSLSRPAVRHAAGRHTGYTDKPSSGASPESRISNT